MAASSSATSTSTSTSTTASSSSSSSHPPRPFVRPLFLGKPLNPPLLRPAAATAADRVVTVANPAAYIRNTNPTAVMTFSTASADQAGAHLMPPPGPHHFSVPRRPVGGAHKTAPAAAVAAAAPKVAQFPAVSLAPESSNFKDSGRERSREDTLVMIRGRKDINSGEDLSTDDLLKGHIKHARKVRSRLRKERLLRIEQYKQRLSLLLPTQVELIVRNDATPKR